MGWIKQSANEHRCNKPRGASDAAEAKEGDVWMCDNPECGRTYQVYGFNSGPQWGDPYPTVIVWREVMYAGDGRWIQK